MEYIKFIFLHNHYILDEYKDGSGLLILAFFLTDDVGPEGQTFKEWIDSPTETETSSNASYLEKRNNGIIIGAEWDKFDGIALGKQHVFETTKEQLKYIIDRWVELWHKDAKEILITRDGDNITVEGKF